MTSCNNRPKWALSPFEPIYCMSFGCPFEIASAGIKEGRQSCYKTTCLVDYSYMFFVSHPFDKLQFLNFFSFLQIHPIVVSI